jgi:hypothetical protein
MLIKYKRPDTLYVSKILSNTAVIPKILAINDVDYNNFY